MNSTREARSAFGGRQVLKASKRMIARNLEVTSRGVVGLSILLGLSVCANGDDGSDRSLEPSVVWAAGPLDVVAVFPRPLPDSVAASLAGKSFSYAASPGASGTKASLKIAGARLVDGGRTLLLATDPHPVSAIYSLPRGTTPASPIALRHDLSGVELGWTDAQEAHDSPAWRGWLDELSSESLTRLASTSAPHRQGLALLKRPGRLTLGTTIGLPTGEYTIRIESNRALVEATLGDDDADIEDASKPPAKPLDLKFDSHGEPQFLSLTIETGPEPPTLSFRVSHAGHGQADFAPLPRQATLLPWAPLEAMSAETAPAAPRLDGGDPKKGEALFFGDQARCGQCHTFRGKGAAIGPDLTEIVRKGPENLYRGIAAPSAEIAPEYVPYTVAAKDGRVFAGLVRSQGFDAVIVTDNAAKSTTLRRDEIDQIRPSGTSIMPVGLAGALGDAALRDLVAYLMGPPAGR